MVLVVTILMLAALAALGVGIVTLASLNAGATGNARVATQMFYLAEAGVEHGREVLRTWNAGSAQRSTFTDELALVRGLNAMLDGSVGGTDDVPIATAAVSAGSYTVYLTNDATDGPSNLIDTNKRVTLTAIAIRPDGAQATVQTDVSLPQIFPPPATITLLGPGASFTGNNSNAKELHGDDVCGAESPKPVVAVSHSADVASLQANIAGSKPATYWTEDNVGNPVNAATTPNAISGAITPSTINSIQQTYGIDIMSASDLNALVATLGTQAHTVAAAGSSSGTVNVGTVANPQVVVVNGDFSLNGDGAGILVVTGKLTFKGNVTYTGLILVIGEGHMQRNGGGNGTISGGIIVANTLGPDDLVGTADDVLGPPTFNTSGGGNSNVNYCSTANYNGLAFLSLRVVAFKQL
jgi:hypothetical protein